MVKKRVEQISLDVARPEGAMGAAIYIATQGLCALKLVAGDSVSGRL